MLVAQLVFFGCFRPSAFEWRAASLVRFLADLPAPARDGGVTGMSLPVLGNALAIPWPSTRCSEDQPAKLLICLNLSGRSYPKATANKLCLKGRSARCNRKLIDGQKF